MRARIAASVAYVDAQAGMVLDALEKSPHKDNTIVVLLGDHGWHLGEKECFGKATLWEEATRAPLIWVAPGVTKPGSRCDATVEFLSIYPTLCDLAGLPKPDFLEDVSMRRCSRIRRPNGRVPRSQRSASIITRCGRRSIVTSVTPTATRSSMMKKPIPTNGRISPQTPTFGQ